MQKMINFKYFLKKKTEKTVYIKTQVKKYNLLNKRKSHECKIESTRLSYFKKQSFLSIIKMRNRI